MKQVGLLLILSITFVVAYVVNAQSDLAATLEVLSSGVAIQRTNTSNFISVNIEAIVGVGDIIRTDETGSARITFFADGTDVTLEPNTEFRIVEFQGDDDEFHIQLEVLAGQTTHRINRLLGANSSYDVETPGITLGAQGTIFAVRVEDSGRSSLITFEDTVTAISENEQTNIPSEFGVRSPVDDVLSDVVRASTFSELDAALDGCAAIVITIDDVSINIRSGPSLDQEILSFIDAVDIDRLVGVMENSNWYRIQFEDGFAWILSSNVVIDSDCPGLRVFEPDYVEDVAYAP